MHIRKWKEVYRLGAEHGRAHGKSILYVLDTEDKRRRFFDSWLSGKADFAKIEFVRTAEDVRREAGVSFGDLPQDRDEELMDHYGSAYRDACKFLVTGELDREIGEL